MKDLKAIFQEKYKEFGIPIPEVHFVLGSLIGSELEEVSKKSSLSQWEKRGRISFSELPDLSSVSAPSHLGCYEYFYNEEQKKSICFQLGRLHGYEGLTARQVVKNRNRALSGRYQSFRSFQYIRGVKKRVYSWFHCSYKRSYQFYRSEPSYEPF